MLFFVSMTDDVGAFGAWMRDSGPHPVSAPQIAGLLRVLDGGLIYPEERFLGWTTGPHPVLTQP